ncbi:hypothetical protein ONA70_14575 [Micromonospora yasonensis]|uniref:DUF6541 family protein n=1 Tax=Micromonospora yasonensis TaxID=1128667 RepID=UPI0022301374|nr:DUF6541 family protein [Micromonospora yasonensis]MCW3841323.1 hypothetical protein [Micromonospora yasonensis]
MTTFIAVAVALLPGALLGFVVPPGRYRWAVWTTAPALTLGLTTVAMGWLPKLGLPESATAVLVAELLLALAAVLVSRLIPRGLPLHTDRDGPDGDADPARAEADGGHRTSILARFRLRPVLPAWQDMVGVAVPAVATVGYGWLLLGRLIAPPGWDAMNHGYFTRRILDTGSATIQAACSTGPTDPTLSCSFYPLATNVSWAQAAELSGGRISTVMTAWSIIVGPLALVAGVYACVRLLGGRPIVASAAALAPTFLGPLWYSVSTGRITQQTGPCIAVGIALLAALSLRGRHPGRLGLLTGLAGAGLVMSHTYDVLFLAVLAVGLIVLIRYRLTLRGLAAGAGAALVGGSVALLPFLGPLTGASGEREVNDPALLGKLGEAFEFWVTDQQRYLLLGFPQPGSSLRVDGPTFDIGLAVTITCLLASPLCLVFRQLRWARPWLVTGVLFTAIGIWTSTSNSAGAMLLAGLWYGVRERLRSMIFPVYGILAVVGAVAILLALQWVVTRLVARARGWRDSTVPAAVGASLLLVTLAVLAAVPATWHPIRGEFKRRAPIGAQYTDTYRWLAANTPPGKVVAYDRHRQFMTWSYVDYDTPLLFGLPPLPTLDVRNYDRRWGAWDWLVNNEGARPAGCDVDRLGVEYVVVGGGRVLPGGWQRHYSQSRLDASDRVHLVQQFGKMKVYQVTDKGRACSSTGG